MSCDTTAHKNLLVVDIDAYIAKPSTHDIILTEYSIDNDSSLEQAVDDCGGGFQLGGDEIGGGYYPAKRCCRPIKLERNKYTKLNLQALIIDKASLSSGNLLKYSYHTIYTRLKLTQYVH